MKHTTRITAFLWVLFLCIWTHQPAQGQKLENLFPLKIGGFMGARTPVGAEKDYTHWAVVELTFKKPSSSISAFYQYDFTASYLREAYWKYSGVTADSSLRYAVRAGKALNSILDSLPGQKSNRLTRLLDATSPYATWPIGLRADLNWKGYWLAITHAIGDNLVVTVSNGECYIFWERRVGPGVMAKPSTNSRWANPIAVMSWNDGDAAASLQNFIRLSDPLRLYGQLDYQNTTGRVDQLVGLAYEYAKMSNLKCFYDSKVNSVIAEATFTF